MKNKDGNCFDCGRIFRDFYSPKGYHPQVKEICLNMYLNGMGFREARKSHFELPIPQGMNWVRESGEKLPEDESEEPEFTQLDELQTYVGCRANKVWNRSCDKSSWTRNYRYGNRRPKRSNFQ